MKKLINFGLFVVLFLSNGVFSYTENDHIFLLPSNEDGLSFGWYPNGMGASEEVVNIILEGGCPANFEYKEASFPTTKGWEDLPTGGSEQNNEKGIINYYNEINYSFPKDTYFDTYSYLEVCFTKTSTNIDTFIVYRVRESGASSIVHGSKKYCPFVSDIGDNVLIVGYNQTPSFLLESLEITMVSKSHPGISLDTIIRPKYKHYMFNTYQIRYYKKTNLLTLFREPSFGEVFTLPKPSPVGVCIQRQLLVNDNMYFKNSRVNFNLPKAGKVSLKLFSLNGRLIADLSSYKDAGKHSISLKELNLSAGNYLLHFKSATFQETININHNL